MTGCCILGCGGFGVSSLRSCAGGGAGALVTAVLNMAASFIRAVVCFSPRCGIGMYGSRFCSASVRSVAELVTASAGDRLGKFLCSGNSLVVSDTGFYAFLGM